MTVRNVRKQLAGMEDLAQGVGTTVQRRGDSDITVGLIDTPYAVQSEAELQALDVTKFTIGRVYSSVNEYIDYAYDPAASEGIPPNVGPGYWIEYAGISNKVPRLTNLVFATVIDAINGITIGGIEVVLKEGESITIEDYATGNNSGVLFFKVVAAGTGIADGGKYIDIPALNLQLEQNLKSPYNPMAWGAVGDGVTDDYPSFKAVYDFLPSTGGTILIPTTTANAWYIGQTLDIRKKVRITGQVSHAFADGFGTELLFPADTAGIVFNAQNTSLYTTVAEDPNLPGAFGSVIEFLRLKGGGGTANVDGLVFRTKVHANKVQARNFARHGIRIHAAIGAGGDIEGNANGWVLNDCHGILNGVDGLYVDGADANVGVATKVYCQSNGRYGFYDDSLIGNTYIGCDTVANATAPAYIEAPSTIIGAWEDGGGESYLGVQVTSHGGNGFNPSDASLGHHENAGIAQNAPHRFSNERGAVPVGSRLGKPDTTMTVFAFGSDDESAANDAWKLKYLDTENAWVWEFANSSSFRPVYFPNSASALWTDRSFAGPVFQSGYAVKKAGSSESALVRKLDTAAPTSGTYRRGDIVYHQLPTAGGNIGWVCVTAGSPGIWKAFGNIDS